MSNAKWKLVPAMHEGRAGLTDAMMRAFYIAFEANSQRGDFERLSAGYNAMLEAAPIAPTTDVQRLRELLADARGYVVGFADDLEDGRVVMELVEWIDEALGDQPIAPAADADDWRSAARAATSHLDYPTDAPRSVNAALRALRAALAQPSDAAAVPVAEVIKWQTFTGRTAWDFKVFDKTLEHGAKLYAAPSAPAVDAPPVEVWHGDHQCRACHGSGWVTRDPDIGTEQECFVCNGLGYHQASIEPKETTDDAIETLHAIQAVLREVDPNWSDRGEFGVKLGQQIIDAIRDLSAMRSRGHASLLGVIADGDGNITGATIQYRGIETLMVPAVDALTTGAMDDPMDVLLGRLKSGGDYAAPLYTAKQGNEPKILTREGLAVLVDHHKAHDGSVDSFELADSFIALMAHPAPSPKAPAPSVEQPLSDEQRTQLELIACCKPDMLIYYIRENTAFDADALERVFELAKDGANALLQSAHTAGGQS